LETVSLRSQGDGAEESRDCWDKVGSDPLWNTQPLVVADDRKVGERPRVPRLVPVVVKFDCRLERPKDVGDGGLRQGVVEVHLPLAEGQVAPRKEFGVVLKVRGERTKALESVLLVSRVIDVSEVVECNASQVTTSGGEHSTSTRQAECLGAERGDSPRVGVRGKQLWVLRRVKAQKVDDRLVRKPHLPALPTQA